MPNILSSLYIIKLCYTIIKSFQNTKDYSLNIFFKQLENIKLKIKFHGIFVLHSFIRTELWQLIKISFSNPLLMQKIYTDYKLVIDFQVHYCSIQIEF